ncbi:MAG: S49 family peptidase, partial [Planctomycetota bacterium]
MLLLPLSWALAPAAADTNDKDKTKKKPKPGVVAVFEMRGAILETPAAEDPFNAGQGESLKDLVSRLEAARDDERVKAIAVMLGGASMGSAQLEELHDTFKAIRDHHKPVYFYGDNLSFAGFALASAGSQISVAPVGDVMILGLYGEQLYLRGLLEKLHIRPDYATCGAYKSAAELFMREGPSKEAEEMQNWIFDSLFATYVDKIAAGRDVSSDKVKGWIDEGIYTASEAAAAGIIDKVEVHADFA